MFCGAVQDLFLTIRKGLKYVVNNRPSHLDY
jgi:hypothetical protein